MLLQAKALLFICFIQESNFVDDITIMNLIGFLIGLAVMALTVYILLLRTRLPRRIPQYSQMSYAPFCSFHHKPFGAEPSQAS
jgi:hypothetical protein